MAIQNSLCAVLRTDFVATKNKEVFYHRDPGAGGRRGFKGYEVYDTWYNGKIQSLVHGHIRIWSPPSNRRAPDTKKTTRHHTTVNLSFSMPALQTQKKRETKRKTTLGAHTHTPTKSVLFFIILFNKMVHIVRPSL